MSVCAWEDCAAPVKVRGFCRPHYNKAWREGIIESRRFKQHHGALCSEPGCGEKARAIEWCSYHYGRRVRLEKYGISGADYALMLEMQGGVCAICRGLNPTERPLYVDHDHDSGWVRGLLCNRCNQGLGYFDDDPRRLVAAFAYLNSVPVLPAMSDPDTI